jgi:hypothetical protein
VNDMKKIWIVLITLLFFSVTCIPAIAVSKGDLITYYRTNPSSLFEKPQIPDTPPPTTTPIILPYPITPILPFPNWQDPSFLKPFVKPDIPPSPIVKPTVTPAPKPAPRFGSYVSCPPFVPVGPLRHPMVYCGCTQENPLCDCVNPETGEHYPIGTDTMGTTFFVKPGCPCRWAD